MILTRLLYKPALADKITVTKHNIYLSIYRYRETANSEIRVTVIFLVPDVNDSSHVALFVKLTRSHSRAFGRPKIGQVKLNV